MSEDVLAGIETVEDARRSYEQLRMAYSAAWMGRDDAKAEAARLEWRRFTEAAVAKFGKPEVPGCKMCGEVSIFGGPGHAPSSLCRSGKRPHCTCSACF